MRKILLGCWLVFLFNSCQSPSAKSPNIHLIATQPLDSISLFAPNIISTSLNERDMAISPDGKEVIFTRGNHQHTVRVLISFQQIGSKWNEPTILPFSGIHNDIEPFFSTDGQKLFFSSNRPIGGDSSRSDYNIWYVQRMGEGWSEPFALDSLINTKGDEFYPSVAENGNLYFTGTYTRGIGKEDIYVSVLQDGIYVQPTALDSTINSKAYEFNAYISPKEDLLIFSSFGRQDGLGGGDLYLSRKDANGSWTQAKNLGSPINTPSLDYCPFIDYPRGMFYFTSNASPPYPSKINDPEELKQLEMGIQNGLGNIYRIGLDKIME